MESTKPTSNEAKNGNKSKPLLQAVAITECLEILTKEMSTFLNTHKTDLKANPNQKKYKF